MAKATKSKKKPIGQYDHKGKKRVNNPSVGLVTPETDKETGKRKYAYDPHIDPTLQFDSQRSQVEKIIDNSLSGETVEGVLGDDEFLDVRWVLDDSGRKNDSNPLLATYAYINRPFG